MNEELEDLGEAVNVWPTLLGATVTFSLAPGLMLHLALQPRRQRPFWIAATLSGVVFEAVPLRVEVRRERKRDRRRYGDAGVRVFEPNRDGKALRVAFVDEPALLRDEHPGNK